MSMVAVEMISAKCGCEKKTNGRTERLNFLSKILKLVRQQEAMCRLERFVGCMRQLQHAKLIHASRRYFLALTTGVDGGQQRHSYAQSVIQPPTRANLESTLDSSFGGRRTTRSPSTSV